MNRPPRTDEVLRPDLSRRARLIGIVLWSSFLAAAAGTMFFFAFIAPEDLIGWYPQGALIDRLSVYSLGFFGLWCLSALAAALALFLHRASGVPPAHANEIARQRPELGP
ncbi:MAG: hypothetical protein ABSE43_15805 [Steroidobacteraceae bacterium]|jgi:hypothetical protein